MRFEPKTEEELSLIFSPNYYQFEVIRAEDAISQSTGNDMIKLQLKIYDNGSDRVIYIFDYLVSDYKIKHFCDSTQLEEVYKKGELKASDCEGRTGLAKLAIKKDKTGEYQDRNEVKDYAPLKKEQKNIKKEQYGSFDDDLPF